MNAEELKVAIEKARGNVLELEGELEYAQEMLDGLDCAVSEAWEELYRLLREEKQC